MHILLTSAATNKHRAMIQESNRTPRWEDSEKLRYQEFKKTGIMGVTAGLLFNVEVALLQRPID